MLLHSKINLIKSGDGKHALTLGSKPKLLDLKVYVITTGAPHFQPFFFGGGGGRGRMSGSADPLLDLSVIKSYFRCNN